MMGGASILSVFGDASGRGMISVRQRLAERGTKKFCLITSLVTFLVFVILVVVALSVSVNQAEVILYSSSYLEIKCKCDV